MKNANKIILAEVTKTLSLINFNSKYIQIINNVHIYIAKNFKFTSRKKILEIYQLDKRKSK